MLPGDTGERARGRHRLQHASCTSGPTVRLLAKHRKLVATGGERLVWGSGDGSTLAVIDTPFGRVGGLICWENYMPLARAAMYEQHIDVLARAHVGQLRRVAAVDATHRQGGPLLRARHHVVPRGSDVPPTSPAATSSTATTTTGCRAGTRSSSIRRARARRPAHRRDRDPLRRHRRGPRAPFTLRVRRRRATTRVPTCSSSA